MSVLTIVALTTITAFVYLVYFKNKRKHDLAKKFPGPPTVPILGNVLTFMRRNPDEILHILTENRNKYGRIYRMKLFNKLAFMVCEPKIVEIVLSNSTKYLTKNRLYQFLQSWLGDGLLLSTGRKWYGRRKIITPAFHFNILEQFVEIFDQQSQILVDRLKVHCHGKLIDIHPFVTLMALDVVCETAMGVKIGAQINKENDYVKAVAEITEVISYRFANIWQRSDLLFALFAREHKRKLDRSLKTLHNFTDSVILSRRQELLKHSNLIEEIKPNEFGISKKIPLLDILLRSSINGEPLSNADIREEVDTFMFEGHDTTTAGIIFTLYLLSRHKYVQDKLFAEIKQVFGNDKNAPITYRQLQELKYIELVTKESFRLYPPVPGIGRTIEEDIKLDNGTILPADSNFNISMFLMFKDPEYFPNPEKFDPERFAVGNIAEKLNSYIFIPFSAGSRNCIGQKFAWLEIKSSISKILRHYELLPLGEPPKTSFELILRTKNGIQLGLKERIYDE